MKSNYTPSHMCLVFGSVMVAILIGLFTKKLLYNFKRPNGNKGGILSIHVLCTFAIIGSMLTITRDPFLLVLFGFIGYLVARGRMDADQHYLYQVLLSGAIGVSIPYAIMYFLTSDSIARMEYADKPANAIDDRHEADDASELKLSPRN